MESQQWLGCGFKRTNIINTCLQQIRLCLQLSTIKLHSYQGHTKNTSPTYSPEIQGWDFRWLELLVAGYPLSSSHSSSSSQLKSQPCISGEYVGLVFLVTGAAGVFGVALVSIVNTIGRIYIFNQENIKHALLITMTKSRYIYIYIYCYRFSSQI